MDTAMRPDKEAVMAELIKQLPDGEYAEMEPWTCENCGKEMPADAMAWGQLGPDGVNAGACCTSACCDTVMARKRAEARP